MPKSVGKQMSINIIASIVSFAVTVGMTVATVSFKSCATGAASTIELLGT